MKLKELDKSDMLGAIGKFPEQISEIVSKVRELDISELDNFRPRKVLVLGMGGSAIGGDILATHIAYENNLPIFTIRDYTVPLTADKSTLVFACSYSGNTEETLSSVKEAHDRGCMIVGITSGGKLEEFCNKNELVLVTIPKGIPPRAAVAYLFFPMLIMLEKLDVIKPVTKLPELLETMKKMRKSFKPDVPAEKNLGKKLAKQLKNGIPYIYGHSYLNVIAKRWQTQLNENSKVLAMSGGFPEMNHNEIVGWAEDNPKLAEQFVVVFLRSADEHPQITKRMDLTKKTLETKVCKVVDVRARGLNRLTRMMSTMYLGDYTSVYLALLRGIDPTPVRSIEELKKQLVE